MTHTIKAHLQLNPSHLVIQTDLANAFNSWSRDKLYPIVDQHFPELSHVIRAAYGNPSQVLFAEPNQPTHSIQSTVGSRQGCVAGSLAFCLALQPILQTIAHEYPDLLILSYCDDMYIIGTPERAAHAYRRYDPSSASTYKHSCAMTKLMPTPPQHLRKTSPEPNSPCHLPTSASKS